MGDPLCARGYIQRGADSQLGVWSGRLPGGGDNVLKDEQERQGGASEADEGDVEVFLEKLELELSLKDKPGVFRWKKRKGTFQAEGTGGESPVGENLLKGM